MAKAKKSHNPATTAMLFVLAVIIAVIAYKQIFLVSMVTSNLPEDNFTKGVESCMQENLAPAALETVTQGNNLKGFWGDLLGGIVSSGVTGNVVNVTVGKNYITEVKVMKLDFFGKNAQMRISGAVDVTSTMPVVGETKMKKDYTTMLFKRDGDYYFERLSVKDEQATDWQEWACAKTL